jgi:hypothetical protein
MDDIYNYCNSCKRKTHHSVEGEHNYESNAEYDSYKLSHKIVKCKGCHTTSFRKEYHNFDEAFQNENGDWDYPRTVEIYPRATKENIKKYHLPDLVDEIYTETCDAYSQKSLILAGIGLRATIEAICNDQHITGKELSTRISNLATKGLISKKDSLRLHSIRFLGNDAAHEITKPSEKQLAAALTIVEHLLTTVYILDGESRGKLISVIEDYPAFEETLIKNVEELKERDEYPLIRILGKDYRRLNGSTKNLESELDKRIGNGEFTMLKFGKKEKFENSPTELQHYIVTNVS